MQAFDDLRRENKELKKEIYKLREEISKTMDDLNERLYGLQPTENPPLVPNMRPAKTELFDLYPFVA